MDSVSTYFQKWKPASKRFRPDHHRMKTWEILATLSRDRVNSMTQSRTRWWFERFGSKVEIFDLMKSWASFKRAVISYSEFLI